MIILVIIVTAFVTAILIKFRYYNITRNIIRIIYKLKDGWSIEKNFGDIFIVKGTNVKLIKRIEFELIKRNCNLIQDERGKYYLL